MSRACAIANWTSFVLRVVLAGLFAFAATVKLGIGPWGSLNGAEDFAISIKGFRLSEVYPWLMPNHAIPFFAFFVPWLELVCAALLLVGLCTRASALVVSGMLIAFMGAIWSVLEREMAVKCGCFGDFSFCPGSSMGVCNLIQNGVMLGAALIVMTVGPGKFALDRLGRRGKAASQADEASPAG